MGETGFEAGLRNLESGPESAAGDAGEPRGPEADAAAHATVAGLRERFGEAVLHHRIEAGDEHVVYIPAERVSEVLSWLKTDPAQAYDYLADLTAVDFGGGRPLEVVYQLWSIEHRHALRVKATLPIDALAIDSVEPLWKAANWLEREAFDLFGIHFRGHPDLRRILMPEKYAEGHPLRKDFPLRGRFSRAEQTRRALELTVEDYYHPDELRIAERHYRRAERDAATAYAGQELSEVAQDATAAAEHAPHPRKAEDWALGAPESGAGGAPGPQGLQE